MGVSKIYVIRFIDYDGGRRGMTWQEKFSLSREGAERVFSEMSNPYKRGRPTSYAEPYVPYEIKYQQPQGFIKSVCHKFSMMMVEMSQEEVLP